MGAWEPILLGRPHGRPYTGTQGLGFWSCWSGHKPRLLKGAYSNSRDVGNALLYRLCPTFQAGILVVEPKCSTLIITNDHDRKIHPTVGQKDLAPLKGSQRTSHLPRDASALRPLFHFFTSYPLPPTPRFTRPTRPTIRPTSQFCRHLQEGHRITFVLQRGLARLVRHRRGARNWLRNTADGVVFRWC